MPLEIVAHVSNSRYVSGAAVLKIRLGSAGPLRFLRTFMRRAAKEAISDDAGIIMTPWSKLPDPIGVRWRPKSQTS